MLRSLFKLLFGAAPPVTFSGEGDSQETAVVIQGAGNTLRGVKAEYQWLIEHFGQRDQDWALESQSLSSCDDKHYDVFEINLKDGTQKTVWFDITEFYGRMF